MPDCNNLLHPFQTDPGSSRQQRIADALLSDAPPVDGRKLADLLDYFVQLSRHVNFYNSNLQISDWQPFFQKSTPFVLATIIRYNHEAITHKFELYNKLFEKNPSAQSLRLLLHYVFYNAIARINAWHLQLKQSDQPVTNVTERLIKDKLAEPVKQFIKYANTAAAIFPVKKPDFRPLQQNEVWNLTEQNLLHLDTDFISSGANAIARLVALRNQVSQLFPSFIDAIRSMAATAELGIEQSLFPLQDELQKKHTPHLGLLFAFIKLFQHLQADLNRFTRKHLDFFYTEVLKINPRGAEPDKVHVVFEIQNQLDTYLLQKGLQVKAGKDANKAEVHFALDDELVVNKAEVADVRTLFLNNQSVYRKEFIQGIYMAPDARKADGLQAPFTGSGIHSFPTVGDRWSKYTDPELKTIKPFPPARTGFMLASPVLLLNEGQRTVEINLACRIKDVCAAMNLFVPGPTSNGCCGEDTQRIQAAPDNCREEQNEPVPTALLFDMVNKALKKTFYHITEEAIQQAIKKGLHPDTAQKIRRRFLTNVCRQPVCCRNEKNYESETVVRSKHWHRFVNKSVTEAEKLFLNGIFKPQRVFKLFFSGEKDWIEPGAIKYIEMTPSVAGPERFLLKMKLVIKADQPAITYYNKEALLEDFNTDKPVFKADLNEAVKLVVNKKFRKLVRQRNQESCCFDKTTHFCAEYLSLYHFFRNVVFAEADMHRTEIKVKVCGLKKFVVQNDESIMDANSPVYPFGTRPKIIDFDINNPPEPGDGIVRNLRGPDFYIGSKEIFSKKWQNICINLNWKDKPVSFNDYYTAYIKRTYPNLSDPPNPIEVLGLNEHDFEVNFSVLENGTWVKEAQEKGVAGSETTKQNVFTLDYNRKLFAKEQCKTGCWKNGANYSFFVEFPDFGAGRTRHLVGKDETIQGLTTDSRNGFLRLNLQNQDFLHNEYAFVLSRQMMALSQLGNQKALEGAVYLGSGNSVIVFKDTGQIILDIQSLINQVATRTQDAEEDVDDVFAAINSTLDIADAASVITVAEYLSTVLPTLNQANSSTNQAASSAAQLQALLSLLKDIISIFKPGSNEFVDDLSVPIPNEPWTPILKNITLDYTAVAEAADIDLIHLYPYTGTYKHEEIALGPALLPSFCDEGNLFIGLKKAAPGSNVNILFQLAEATADSESEREDIHWYYLDSNTWKPLRNGFEVLDDATNGLTTSGIIKLALPVRMGADNTIMPAGLHWIKAAIAANSKSVSETIGLHTQAVRATYTNEDANDKMRMAQPLAAGSISKLKEADTSVKKIAQPYDSFEGRIPEIEGQYYVRVSEYLRHKGRAIQKFDYERLTLEAFPQLLKAKCINHSFALNAHEYKNDFPIAPGYVLLAVLPDLNKLKAPESFEPKAPVSLLEKVADYITKRTSPFVRLRVMNARYEKVHFCLKVKLHAGKDENYYREKLQQDLREFLAPWAIGQYDLLTFGQCVNRSDLIRFLETRDYVDYLLALNMQHEADGAPLSTIMEVCPKTPRSILIAGHVEVCIVQNDCEAWDAERPCRQPAYPVIDYCKRDQPVIN